MGGKNKVSMTDLKALLDNAGFENLDSYINSGNLFFSSAESREACILKIRKVLETNYDFSIPFALLTKEEYLVGRTGGITGLVGRGAGKKRCFVLFLWYG